MASLDSECEIERSKTAARWLGIAILGGLLWWQRRHGLYGFPWPVFWALLGAAAAINLAHAALLYSRPACPPAYKYASVGIDLAMVSMVTHHTGASLSPFFFAYFVLLVSNCIRYGLLMSVYVAGLVNVLYVAVLAASPPLPQTVLGGEGLKILAFWGIAIYGGVVSARMRRQAHEIEACMDTIASLRAELETVRSRADA